MWTQSHRQIKWKSWVSALFYILPRVILLPLIAIPHICYPHFSVFRSWRAPIIKFSGFLTSYLIVLILLILEVTYEDKGSKAARLNGPLDYVVWIYVASYAFNTIKSLYFIGSGMRSNSGSALQSFSSFLHSVKKDWWLIADIIMMILFVLSFITAAISLYDLHNYPSYQNTCRVCWNWNDPTLISEGLFAVAVVFAFGKLLYFFRAFSLLGPIQISLSRMIYDVREMFLILVITIIAFSSGLYSLYHYYKDMKETGPNGSIQEQPNDFTT